MAKALTTLGMLIAVLIVLVFALDIASGLPFGGGDASLAMDIGMIIGGLILLYLSWAAWREQT